MLRTMQCKVRSWAQGARKARYLVRMNAVLYRWFDTIPEEWRPRAEQLHLLILQASPSISEENRHGVPSYVLHRWMCYLSFQKGSLILGFMQGNMLVDAESLLARTEHKLIRHYRVPAPGLPLDAEAVNRLILEAVVVNMALSRTAKHRPVHRARLR